MKKKIDTQIANITVHVALNTPHSWILIPRVMLFDERGTCRIQDIRICQICNKGERLVGRADSIWKEIGTLDVMSILEKYEKYRRGL